MMWRNPAVGRVVVVVGDGFVAGASLVKSDGGTSAAAWVFVDVSR